MKKLLIIVAIALSLCGATFAATGDLRSRLDNLSDEIPFGYTTTQKISVSSISNTSVTISSPKLQDELGNDIKKYTLMYSQYPLSDILENTNLLDQSKEKTFTFTTVPNPVTFPLDSVADSIDPTKVYYISVIPKDQANILGEISNEIRFKMSDKTYGEGIYTGTHAAAGADMNLANVTHVIAGNKVTLRRTAVNGSDTVDIFLWDPTAQVFTRLGTVNMSAEKYEFTISRNGEFIVNFLPNNGGREKRYTFTVTGVTGGTPGTTPIQNVPHVGPTENIIVALFIAFVLYLLYRRNLRRKSIKH